MWQLSHTAPWLVLRLDRPMRSLGWTPQQGGQALVGAVLWREVRNSDLPPERDAVAWLADQTRALDHGGTPCFLTSARIADHAEAQAESEGATARALATAGLGNAERIGQRRGHPAAVGTLNLLVAVNRPLQFSAALEALSLMAEARTAAMLDHAPRLWPEQPTGTGTDCLCLLWPEAGRPDEDTAAAAAETYAGKHTALGEVVGRAAYQAFATAIGRWSPPS